ncbi:hypothetical protein AXG93_4427s1000 [Marchantia polymorpha subsp. ruderalis]|uniref:Uncharacterized protein n=1 Tax=Marchantia polymorpha subsp. ruderalis TaxID=1480154 RepID=A0A176W0V6_MARPO|nr:hypothetical protein AXG93_4427s1000 [Marchantia polymorpha subsp. ruderalis]
MKARRLVLEADNITESRAAALLVRFTPKAGVELIMVREKKASVEKDMQTSTVSPTPVVPSQATRKEKVSSDIENDPVALEKVAERAVEDVEEEAFAPQKVMSSQTSIGTVILEPGEDPLVEET